jgi:hypothetical protein
VNPRLLEWIFENLGLVIVLAITALSFLRGMFRAGQTEQKGPVAPRSRMEGEEDPEAAERTRRIQEEIRRKIAERQGRAVPVEEERVPVGSEPTWSEPPPLLPPKRVPPVDPFGGSMRKILRKLEEAAEQRRETVRDEIEPVESAALRRQRELEEQLRAVEAQRAETKRRAREIAAGEIGAAAAPKTAWASASVRTAGAGVREELKDPRALRRAFVLREVLGPPVGLR